MAHEIHGNWQKGWAFDLHTTSSTYIGDNEAGHPQFDSTRSEIGELIYQLKYNEDKKAVPGIIELLKGIGNISAETFDFIIPVPSSKARAFQPVDEIATALGQQRGVPVLVGYLTKEAGGTELKGITDPEERAEALKGKIKITGTGNISGKAVLLFDDLYRSGATLNACCSVLYEQADVSKVCVLTATKTRSKR